MPVYPGNVHRIRIGARTNIQDGSVLHVTHETHPLTIGEGVVIGHAAVVHGCTIEDGALIPGIAARYVRLKDEYLEMLAREAS